MARRLPPLNALRAFEAAARHLSFTRAAQELNVTQAAISHQVKSLETHLGFALFRRLNRSLLLTDAGQSLFPPVGDALDGIDQAVRRLDTGDAAGVLTVSCLHSFAATWLVPRLVRFRDRHPEIDIRIATSDEVSDFVTDDVDIAIRYGPGDWPGLHVTRLMGEALFPVCSPALLKGGPPLEQPADLRHYTLLHDDMREDWSKWLLAARVDDVDAKGGAAYSHSNLLVQAAVSGAGVILGRSVLVADALADGSLVRPFDISLPANYAYYVVAPEATVERPKVAAFRGWLLDEVARAGGDGTGAS
jgi:LysR family transcriptional regulator, glycine cleavage system transcriptional activator